MNNNRAKYLNDVLSIYESEDIISKLPPLTLEDFGTEKMLKKHNDLERINMQSIKNALLGGEDFILETFVSNEKIKDLITELYLCWAFKKLIYPKISKEIIQINSVKTYIILYHEAVILNILENFFFHVTACTAAEEYLVDILEYCYEFTSKLIFSNKQNAEKNMIDNKILKNNDDTDTEYSEMEQKLKDLEHNIGLSCISIFRYISDHLMQLPFPVRHHMMDVKDIPMIFVALMENKPWIRKIPKKITQISSIRDDENYHEEVYENNKWININTLGNKLPKIEAQIWICLYNLFMNQDNTKKYEITEFRKSNLLRLRKYMNDSLFDQIPPLQQMYRALEEISLMSCNSSTTNNPFIVEMIPMLYNNLIQGNKSEYYKNLSEKILENNFKKSNKKKDMDLISEIYNFDNLEYFMDDPKCSNCGKDASNRCSRCKNEWYCGKDCQKICWKIHKEICKKISDMNKENEDYENKKNLKKDENKINNCLEKIVKEEGLLVNGNKNQIEVDKDPKRKEEGLNKHFDELD